MGVFIRNYLVIGLIVDFLFGDLIELDLLIGGFMVFSKWCYCGKWSLEVTIDGSDGIIEGWLGFGVLWFREIGYLI